MTLLRAIVDTRIAEDTANQAKYIGTLPTILNDLREAGYTGAVVLHLAEGQPKAVEVVSKLHVRLR